jgi:hypothetical protein
MVVKKMPNPKPKRPDESFLFKSQWKTGKTVQRRIPLAIETPVLEIARCLDRDPTIAAQVLEFAQSLVERSTK